MNTVLVSGASGFVGENIIPYLSANKYQPINLCLRDKSWEQHMPRNYNAIIHLAGKAHDTKDTSSVAEYFAVNTELTKRLFNLFLRSGACDFIYFSSVKAAADVVRGILTEDTVPNPQTPYGQSKRQAEQYLLSHVLPEGKRLFILRPCMIHGPGNKGNLNLLYEFVSKGIPYPLAAFTNRRSFLSVENLCYVVRAILDDPTIPPGIYNLADDEALSTNDLVRIIATTLHKRPKLLAIPQGLLSIAAKVGDSLKLPLNSERLKKLTENYVVANQKIKSALGIMTLPVAAKEGLKKTIESFRSE